MLTDFRRLLGLLKTNDVDFILIGGVAGNALGSVRTTVDLDIVYRRTDDNHERLTNALAAINPTLRGAPPGLPFRFDRETIKRGLNFTLSTDAGAIDLLGEVIGGGTFDQLLPGTLDVEVLGVQCKCVDLNTLIHLKRSAGRPKDFDAIATLEALLDERTRVSE